MTATCVFHTVRHYDGNFIAKMKSTTGDMVAQVSHAERLLVCIPVGAFLHGVCMFFTMSAKVSSTEKQLKL